MKKTRGVFLYLKNIGRKIHLVDKCLILFMAVLLLQSAFVLFTKDGVSEEFSTIDVIVRTSVAGIFGYFLSANFIRDASQSRSSPETTPTVSLPALAGDGPRSQIGFADTAVSGELTSGSAAPPPARSETATEGRLQIIIAAGIGIFCLVSLILLRNLAEMGYEFKMNPAISATISQFRDIVSGCVGFLIGCPTSKASR